MSILTGMFIKVEIDINPLVVLLVLPILNCIGDVGKNPKDVTGCIDAPFNLVRLSLTKKQVCIVEPGEYPAKKKLFL